MLIDVRDAKARLADLIERATQGEDIVIADCGKPMACLVSVEDGSRRRPGLAGGRVTDAFFEPLPDDELAVWER